MGDAGNMSEINKQNVYEVYDKIFEWYDNARTKTLMEKEYLDLVLDHIGSGSNILDLGCGTAEPIAKFFIEKGHNITGIDGADNMIAICKERFPKQEWILGDMRECNLKKKFSAIIAWGSFFHLPHDDQRHMFSIFKGHAENGAILVFTSGPKHGEIISQMDGHDFYHASLGEEENEQLLKDHGFKVMLYRAEDKNCGGQTVWVAKYDQ
ncbi:MAG: class I SAM-dependent methyltransferase [Proteobacteria bacterium]|nr:class I SAM-dependent methyltransferase [Pseudomonadota bacterium]